MTAQLRELQQYWMEVLRRDLEGFADPQTEVLVDATAAIVTAVWTQRGRDLSATFRLSKDADFRWFPQDDATPLTYRQFLSSEQLADFGQLAGAMARSVPGTGAYVATKASAEAGLGDALQTESSDTLLLSRTIRALDQPPGKTQLLFLKGDAGSGKTTLLRDLTRQQAKRYISGESHFLFLYVSAQGRALSNLRDALSGELDDLRAGFTRDAVPPLVRQGLVVPIIDGFDELLGAAGYSDAFGSLHQFLDQLGGRGALLVSARSSFYDVEFLSREITEISRSSAYDIVPVTLLPWEDEEIFQYLARSRKRETVSAVDQKAVADLSPSDRELLAKPFFTSLFPAYVDSATEMVERVSLSDYLVDSYVQRESEKIVDRDGRPLLDAEGHKQILVLTAEFMWGGEKRDFSAEDLRVVAELIADQLRLAGDSSKQLVTKITSYAGFRTLRRGGEQRFQFEHEVYFDHFLAEALRGRIDRADALGSFLDGGLLPEEVIRSVVQPRNVSQWLRLLDGFGRAGALQENRRRNAGTLAANCFRVARDIKGIAVNSCRFVNTSFGEASFDSVAFNECQLVGVHLERATFRNCLVSNSLVESMVVSGNGHLGIRGLVPGENLFCVVDVATGQEIFSPGGMKKLLQRAGALGVEEDVIQVTYSARAERMLDLLQRVAQKYRQSNLLCLEDASLFRLSQDPDWPLLQRLLLDCGIVSEETRDTSGSKKAFLRYKAPLGDLMRLERDPNLPTGPTGDFWRALRQI